jgi:BirA family biotin operon repressor/biotin-[acetyl-CoA-carboxylase] ligase
VTDNGRPGLDPDELSSSLAAPWTTFELVDETESTNSDLLGGAPGSVLAAEYQRAGRGRLDRTWVSPARSGLLFSAVVRPPVPAGTWGWLPLLSGVAVCDAVRRETGLAISLKWPNDILIGDLKVAGMLIQGHGDTAVIGIGLNVSTTIDELPVETATSLAIATAAAASAPTGPAVGLPSRTRLLQAILAELGSRYLAWAAAGGDAVACGLAADYRARCATIGREVTVVSHDGSRPARALRVDDDGRLVVRWDDSRVDGTDGASAVAGGDFEQALAAGDIVHLRVTGPSVG